VLPLQFKDGENAASLGLDGSEIVSLSGLADAAAKTVKVSARREGGKAIEFEAVVRIDTPKERQYYENGGILHFVLRQLAEAGKAA